MVNPSEIKRLLIVRLGALGDVVHALPALSALKRAMPHARIHWAVETASSSLLLGHPDLARVHVVPRKEWSRSLRDPAKWGETIRQGAVAARSLREEGFDLSVDFQGNLRSAAVARISGAPVRLGFGPGACKEMSHLFQTVTVVPERDSLHKAEKNMALLAPLGISGPPRVDPFPPSDQIDLVRAELAGMTRPVIVFHGGVSRFGALKSWPPASFAAAAAGTVARTGGTALFTFGPGEKEQAEELVRETGEGARLAPDGLSLRGLLDLFGESDAFCGVDTGPTQLAALAGTAVVALFGPKDPAIYRPLGERVRVVSAAGPELDCIPCNGRRCTKAGADGFSPCMTGIDAETVAQAIVDALES